MVTKSILHRVFSLCLSQPNMNYICSRTLVYLSPCPWSYGPQIEKLVYLMLDQSTRPRYESSFNELE